MLVNALECNYNQILLLLHQSNSVHCSFSQHGEDQVVPGVKDEEPGKGREKRQGKWLATLIILTLTWLDLQVFKPRHLRTES